MGIKILTYNIHKGFSFDNRRFVLEQIKKTIQNLAPDVVFLQEVMGENSEDRYKIPAWETTSQFEYLAEAVWPHHAYGKNAVYQQGHHGNAILSKYPIEEWSNQVISNTFSELRGLLTAKIRLPKSGQEILLANTHLDLRQAGREEQSERIIQTLSEETCPWLLVGDFNDWNRRLSSKFEGRLGAVEAHKHLHGKLPLTFPSFFPLLPLDRVYLRGLRPLKAQRPLDPVWKKLSDHIPMYIEVDLPPVS